MTRHLLLSLSLTVFAAACTDAKRRPIGESCGGDSDCESGLCLAGVCLDPEGDEDFDGLINAIEGSLKSNPFNQDTDYDGVFDRDELNPDLSPRDTDGDGIPDILESRILDADRDCIPDELDPENATPNADPAIATALHCAAHGVCATEAELITLTCEEGTPRCDFSAISAWEATETLCDDLDNDCDGRVDQGTAGTLCLPPGTPVLDAPRAPTNAATPVLTGRAEPNSSVTVFLNPDCTEPIGNALADDTGAVTVALTLPDDGSYTLYTHSQNAAQAVSPCVAVPNAYIIDRTPPSGLGDPDHFTTDVPSFDAEKATFVVGGPLPEPGELQVFLDATCATPVPQTPATSDTHFEVRLTAPAGTAAAFARACDLAGNCSPCTQLIPLYGPITVTASSGETPRSGLPVYFHFPDGTPTSNDPVTTGRDGEATIQGFAGFGATVFDLPSDGTIAQLTSVLGLHPGAPLRIDRAQPVTGERRYLTLTWPAPPALVVPENMHLIMYLDCGSISVYEGNSVQRYFLPECFGSGTFDALLIAYDVDSAQPFAYASVRDIPTPGPNQTSVALAADWKTTDWLESTLTLTAGHEAVAWGVDVSPFVSDISLVGGSGLRSGLLLPDTSVELPIKIPALDGASAFVSFSAWYQLFDNAINWHVIGAQVSPPNDATLDAQRDFLPRIYAAELVTPQAPSGASLPPERITWQAGPGMSAADLLSADISGDANTTSIRWTLMARPSEQNNLTIPKFPPNSEAGSLIASAFSWGWNMESLAWFDFTRLSGFDDAIATCGGVCTDLRPSAYGLLRATLFQSRVRLD